MPNGFHDFLKLLKSNFKYARRKRQIRREVDPKQVAHLIPKIKIKKSWYGSVYGGFYVLPQFITTDSIIYSFGIGTDITFDLKCIAKHQCRVFGFDPTPKSINWIKNQTLAPNFSFYDFGISKTTGSQTFYLPKRVKGTSGSLVSNPLVSDENKITVAMKSFPDIIAEHGHQKIDVLKMDIEGAEYDVIHSILTSGVQIDQFLIEFHDRFYDVNDYKSKEVVKSLEESGYVVFGCSSSYEEVSFIRKELIQESSF